MHSSNTMTVMGTNHRERCFSSLGSVTWSLSAVGENEQAAQSQLTAPHRKHWEPRSILMRSFPNHLSLCWAIWGWLVRDGQSFSLMYVEKQTKHLKYRGRFRREDVEFVFTASLLNLRTRFQAKKWQKAALYFMKSTQEVDASQFSV